MAPRLRSSSNSHSNRSRPPTPLDSKAATGTSTAAKAAPKPTKRRRTGRNTRAATDPPQDTAPLEELVHKPPGGSPNGAGGSQSNGKPEDWVEPQVTDPAPSYKDTPWSAVSSEMNPILSTMRPLGSLPSPADLRKAGLVPPTKPIPQVIPITMDSPLPVLDGENYDQTSTAPTPVEDVLELDPAGKVPDSRPDLATFHSLPMSAYDDEFDMDRIRALLKVSLDRAYERGSLHASNGLISLWESCAKDPFGLSILTNYMDQVPDEATASEILSDYVSTLNTKKFGPKQAQATRDASHKNAEILDAAKAAADKAAVEKAAIEKAAAVKAATSGAPMTRSRSGSSGSTLSSAKSLDVDTFAPEISTGPAGSRSRAKGKQAKAAPQKGKGKAPAPAPGRSAFPDSNASANRKRELEEDDAVSEQIAKKTRTRLQRAVPKIIAKPSELRSSNTSTSKVPSPLPGVVPQSEEARDAAILDGVQRSATPESISDEDNRRLTPTFHEGEPMENNDFCRNCEGSGSLLCCDGCVNSFHFSCLDPPLDPANPPAGEWYCPKCSMSRPMRSLLGTLDNVGPKEFALPERIQDYFTGVKTVRRKGTTNPNYDDTAPFPRIHANPNARPPRDIETRIHREYFDPALLKVVDGDGKLIFCFACCHASDGRRPLIRCDYCPLRFHLDCLDPPMAHPPDQRAWSGNPRHNWMCPNHAYHDMYYTAADDNNVDVEDLGFDKDKHRRIRRPKHPRLIDVDVLPEEDEVDGLDDHDEGGVTYRVSERGLKTNFLERVKRENAEFELKAKATQEYLEHAKAKFDEITAKASAYYASQEPLYGDVTCAIINSRTAAEREAAAGLMAFSQVGQPTPAIDNTKINLLVDQLKANEPQNLPKPETEIASLRHLRGLIDQRINMLTDHMIATSARQSVAPQSEAPTPRSPEVQMEDTQEDVEPEHEPTPAPEPASAIQVDHDSQMIFDEETASFTYDPDSTFEPQFDHEFESQADNGKMLIDIDTQPAYSYERFSEPGPDVELTDVEPDAGPSSA